MARISFALAGVSALAIAALPAVAQAQGMAPIHGTIAGQYSSLDVGGGSDVDAWFGDVGAVYNGGIGVGGQANLGFGTLDGAGSEADLWGIGGALSYRMDDFKAGAGMQYQSLGEGGSDINVTNYGVAGEAYFGDMMTVAGRFGGFSGSPSTDGWYIGGGAAIYPIPNLALMGDYDLADPDGSGDITSYGVGAEFLPFATVPVTIGGGYSNSQGFFGDDVDVWRISLKAYLGTPGNGTLVENHRNGALNMGNVVGNLLGQ
jgi:hypothetical protein